MRYSREFSLFLCGFHSPFSINFGLVSSGLFFGFLMNEPNEDVYVEECMRIYYSYVGSWAAELDYILTVESSDNRNRIKDAFQLELNVFQRIR
jgi:hypothetical protein